MRKRSVILLVVAPFVALLAGGFFLLRTFDLDQFRERVTAEIRAATGRDVATRGGVHVAVSLTPTITMNDLEIGTFSSGSRAQMLVVKRFETHLRLVPLLLARRLEIERVIMAGADLLLETDPSGKRNWMFASITAASLRALRGAISWRKLRRAP
jgi:AsmA protein